MISPYANTIRLPEECELAVKEKDGQVWLFVLNFSWAPQEIELKEKVTDLDTQKEVTGVIRLAPFETKVYRLRTVRKTGAADLEDVLADMKQMGTAEGIRL